MSETRYYPHNPKDVRHGGADAVVDMERAHLLQWRGCEPRYGLALSGGGIRSASYCLGVLQALAHGQALPKFDYLSTVSGGGYIGTSMSYLLSQTAPRAPGGGNLPGGANAPGLHFDVSRAQFPYLSYPMVSVPPAGATEPARAKGRLLHRLRQNARYLTAGNGITLLSVVGVLLRNLVVSTLVHVAVLLLLLQALIGAGWLAGPRPLRPQDGIADLALLSWPPNGVLQASWWVFLVFVLMSLLYVLATGFFDWIEQHAARPSPSDAPAARTRWVYGARRAYDVSASLLLALSAALLVVGGLPVVHVWLHGMHWPGLQGLWTALTPSAGNQPAAVGGLAALIGVIGNLWGLLQSGSDKKPLIPTRWIVLVASALLLFGGLLLVYLLALWLPRNWPGWSLAIAVSVLLVLGLLPHANYVSLHRFYRDRLMELFLPDLAQICSSLEGQGPEAETLVGKSVPGDQCLLARLCGVGSAAGLAPTPLNGPYHLINANLVLVASKHPLYRARGGDNFILSPLVCGSRATGWRTTDAEPGKGLTAATAMAISGAALNPNTGGGGEGVTRQPLLSVLMGLLNLRLGYWAKNPNQQDGGQRPSSTLMRWLSACHPNMLSPGLFESFARESLNEHEAQLLLTDGGHFENLGLYELVRRRLAVIVVCDATADADFKFTDLANAIEKVRTDFGAIIDIQSEDLAALVPRRQPGAPADTGFPTAQRSYLIAPITYAPHSDGEAASEGLLIYLKATFFETLSAELYGYRSAHDDFPNQPTGDQFFDERQFEAYRELGYMACWRLLEDLHAADAAAQPPLAMRAAAWVRA